MNCQILPEFTWNTWKNRAQGENKEGPSAPYRRVMRGILTHLQTFLSTFHPGNSAACQKRDCCSYTSKPVLGVGCFPNQLWDIDGVIPIMQKEQMENPEHHLPGHRADAQCDRGLNSPMTPNLDDDFCVPLSITWHCELRLDHPGARGHLAGAPEPLIITGSNYSIMYVSPFTPEPKSESTDGEVMVFYHQGSEAGPLRVLCCGSQASKQYLVILN